MLELENWLKNMRDDAMSVAERSVFGPIQMAANARAQAFQEVLDEI